MGRKKIDQNIKMADEVEQAMVGFKPVFGSEKDIALLTTLGEYKNLLTLQAGDKDRARQLKAIMERAGMRKQDIEAKKENLLWQLEERKQRLSTLPTAL